MKPGLGVYRRHERRFVQIGVRGFDLLGGDVPDLFGVPLLHHAEAAKFALDAVEIAVVVGIAGDKAVAADAIVGLHALHHVDRKRQPGDPGRAGLFVGQVKTGRWCVVHPGLGAQIVFYRHEQVWFLPAHQVDEAHGRPCIVRQRRGPHQAGGAVSQQVHCRNGRQVVDAWKRLQRMGLAPSVARLIEVEPNAIPADVDDVVGAGTVDIGQADAALVELVRGIQPGCISPWSPWRRSAHSPGWASSTPRRCGAAPDRSIRRLTYRPGKPNG